MVTLITGILETEQMLPNLFYEANITLRQRNYKKRELQTNLLYI